MAHERCYGCGAGAHQHPWVGVTRNPKTGHMDDVPICALCYYYPAHRQHTLKMHFFDRGNAATAVDAAERNILVDPPASAEAAP